jgi:hypothetical protein
VGAPLERPDAVRPAVGDVEHADGGLDVDHVLCAKAGNGRRTDVVEPNHVVIDLGTYHPSQL